MTIEPDSKIHDDMIEESSGVSRRKVIKMIGAATVAGFAVGWLPKSLLSGEIPASEAPHSHEDGHGHGAVTSSSSERLRQWMMIIDMRYCDGCQSQGTPPQCTTACNTGHFVPEPMQWIEVYEHELSKDVGEATALNSATHPAMEGTKFMPTPCQQCQNAPCVNVCPVGATWTTPEGITLIDQNRCIGCRMCMAACPYERRSFTWGEPPVPPENALVGHSVEHQLPMKKGVVYKCDFCPEMARAGRLPFCASSCPQNAIYYGDLEEDVATNGKDVVRVSEFLAEHSAFRYKEELRTRPRVYYIDGHGELAGRKPSTHGLMPVRWEWEAKEGAKSWGRSS